MPAMAAVQLGQRLGLQRFSLQFLELVLQPGLALGDVATGKQGFTFLLQRLPPQRLPAHRLQQAGVARMRIQQAGLGGPRQQRLLLVLAVDFDQQGGQFGQLSQPDRAPVDPCAGAAIGPQGAAQQAGAGIVKLGLPQPRRGGALLKRELCLQFGAIGAMADCSGIGARTAQEAKRVHQQRLAGTGFARNHGEAATEVELGVGNNGEVSDREAGQHR